RRFHASRLAWFYVHGVWPTTHIDHRDNDALNNRLENLREANDSQNQANRGKNKNSTSGYKGVYWDKSSGRWAANIWKNYQKIWLGCHETPGLAYAAFCAASRKPKGEFARFE